MLHLSCKYLSLSNKTLLIFQIVTHYLPEHASAISYFALFHDPKPHRFYDVIRPKALHTTILMHQARYDKYLSSLLMKNHLIYLPGRTNLVRHQASGTVFERSPRSSLKQIGQDTRFMIIRIAYASIFKVKSEICLSIPSEIPVGEGLRLKYLCKITYAISLIVHS